MLGGGGDHINWAVLSCTVTETYIDHSWHFISNGIQGMVATMTVEVIAVLLVPSPGKGVPLCPPLVWIYQKQNCDFPHTKHAVLGFPLSYRYRSQAVVFLQDLSLYIVLIVIHSLFIYTYLKTLAKSKLKYVLHVKFLFNKHTNADSVKKVLYCTKSLPSKHQISILYTWHFPDCQTRKGVQSWKSTIM